jgi:hypothetical protein
MWDDCGETSDEENFSPDITVKEMRNGLYLEEWIVYFGGRFLDSPTNSGASHKIRNKL